MDQRHKLLRLLYDGRISEELFDEDQRRLTGQIDALRSEEHEAVTADARSAEVADRFEEIAAYLADLDVETIWAAATESERRVLVDELVEGIEVHHDHLEVTVRGAPRLNVTLAEVGLERRGRRLVVSEGGLEPPPPCGD